MHDDKHSKIWVPIVIILIIIGLVWFAWWSVSKSKMTSSEILNSRDKETTQKTNGP